MDFSLSTTCLVYLCRFRSRSNSKSFGFILIEYSGRWPGLIGVFILDQVAKTESKTEALGLEEYKICPN